ncbi:MAG: sugar transferase [Lachnospiraceae bacterium]|nr:sugar transferase [Lachnospiraceae bacterium]
MFIRETAIRKYGFLLIDMICIFLSILFANIIRFDGIRLNDYNNLYVNSALVATLVGVFGHLALGLDRHLFDRGLFQEFLAVIKFFACVLIGLLGYLFFSQRGTDYSRLQVIYFSVIFIVMNYAAHLVAKAVVVRSMANSSARKRILLVTTTGKVDRILDRFEKNNNWYFLLSGIVFLDRDAAGETIRGIPVIANKDNMLEACKEITLDGVFINTAYSDHGMYDIKSILHAFQSMGAVVHINIDALELDVSNKVIENLGNFRVVSYMNKLRDPLQVFIKRVIDIIGALVGLLITAVIAVFVVPAIMIESPGSPIFSQIRVGRNGRHFKIYKFRSMYRDADARKQELMARNEMTGAIFKMEDDPRVTRVGRFIRKHSIDELPQFLNVLKGDMSLVGTRPPTVDEVEQYRIEHKRRLSVTPGLTGLWQTSGRSKILDFDEIVRMDLEYIDTWSLLLDAKLILKTVGIVFTGSGAQ